MPSFPKYSLGRFAQAVIWLALLSAPAAARSPEDSVFVYGMFNGDVSCPAIEQRLADLPLRKTAILSVERSGGHFVLDDPGGPDRLRCALRVFRSQRRRVKFLLLQDTGFLAKEAEAVRRMRAVAAFGKKNSIEAAVVDIEPYVDSNWSEGSAQDRRAIAANFTRILRLLKDAARPLRLEAAVPWWLPSTENVPEIGLKPLFDSVDGVYLMLYSLGGSAGDTVAARIANHLSANDPILQRGRVYLTISTEDEPSQLQLERDVAELHRQYRHARGFAGVSVFHAAGAYAPPPAANPEAGALPPRP